MRAVGYQTSLPIENPASLQDIDLPKPTPSGRDLLVEIKAISVNPVDTKVRRSAAPEKEQWRVLGWDAAGTAVADGAYAVSYTDTTLTPANCWCDSVFFCTSNIKNTHNCVRARWSLI